MAVFFDYQDGHLEARFSHDVRFDYINLDIRLGGDVRYTTEVDSDGNQLAPTIRRQQASTEFTVYMSSVFCPFIDFIRFLEAIVIGVHKCAFTWDAEGPDGEMGRELSTGDSGLFTIQWHSSDGPFTRSTPLRKRAVVENLYLAFRHFVESPDYDPMRYESLTCGQSCELLLKGESLEQLTQALLPLSAKKSAVALGHLFGAVGAGTDDTRHPGFSIDQLLEMAGPEPISDIVPAEWDRWTLVERREHLLAFFARGSSSWYGENLRELRSRIIEEWIAALPIFGANHAGFQNPKLDFTNLRKRC